MIPKILHFIWFGRKPQYVKYSIDAFMKMNHDFEINFVDNSLRYQFLINDIHNVSGRYANTIGLYKRLGRSEQQILSNILRLELLNEYGGIYLDCDCFPIHSFDDYLLSDDFVVKRFYTSTFNRRDCFFMGKTKSTKAIIDYSTFKAKEITILDKKADLSVDFLKRRKQFQNCQLNSINNTGRYIEHFNLEAWKK